jgi:hypothetical protein
MATTTRIVPIHPGARTAWEALRGIAYAVPGVIVQGLGGEMLLIREDGGAVEVNAIPRRWSASADPTSTRRAG